jgi:O-antigen ligase
MFALLHLALDAWQKHQQRRAILLAGGALIFFANIVFVATSRTSVVVFFALALIFGLQRFRWKGAIAGVLAACVIAAAAAAMSPYLRTRVLNVIDEVHDYRQSGAETSSGYRLEFWKKSVNIISQAPVIGHGTGSTEEMFRRDAVDQSGMSAVVTPNPHNQILAIGIQLGFLGIAVLVAMWIAHGLLFCQPGLAATLGLAVVVQNVVSSLSNSQLFYFEPGWLYVFGVGVLGGAVLRELRRNGLSARRTAAG